MAVHPPQPDDSSQYDGPSAVAAWNLVGGFPDGEWFVIMVESYGITNPELFMRELAVIRDFQNRSQR